MHDLLGLGEVGNGSVVQNLRGVSASLLIRTAFLRRWVRGVLGIISRCDSGNERPELNVIILI